MNEAEVAHCLLRLGCVEISCDRPFTYASGTTGPIYCDNRRVLSHPRERQMLADALAIKLRQWGRQFDSLGGVATAGVAHAALVSERFQCPMIYIRTQPKAHGKKGQVEGLCRAQDRVVLVEDVVNQGHSLVSAAKALVAMGAIPVAALVLVDYQMARAKEAWEEISSGAPLLPLTYFETLLQVQREEGKLDAREEDFLRSWHQDPRGFTSA